MTGTLSLRGCWWNSREVFMPETVLPMYASAAQKHKSAKICAVFVLSRFFYLLYILYIWPLLLSHLLMVLCATSVVHFYRLCSEWKDISVQMAFLKSLFVTCPVKMILIRLEGSYLHHHLSEFNCFEFCERL